MKDTDHLFLEYPVHLCGERSPDEPIGCALRDEDFARGQKVRLGWSDPTFDGLQPPKDPVGSLQPNGTKRSVSFQTFLPAPRRKGGQPLTLAIQIHSLRGDTDAHHF